MNPVLQDFRYALRSLRKNPGFAVVALLTLAIGIGANSAIFSVVNGVVLRPLQYDAPDRLVVVTSTFPGLGFDRFWISPPEYMELQERNEVFEEVGAYRTGTASIESEGAPLRVTSSLATAELFDVLGVDAAIGRTFTRDEDQPGGDPVVVLSWDLWETAFGSDPDLVGRTVRVNGTTSTVVGVMPPGFDVEDAGVEIWTPAALNRSNRQNRGSHYLYLIARLRSGVSPDQARADLDRLVGEWQVINPGVHTPAPQAHTLQLAPLQDDLIGGVRTALYLLLGAVGFVLLIACANVANLLLARAESRQKEIAVRVAMGAGGRRLMRQFLTEGVVLGMIGGVFGLGLAWLGLRVLLALNPSSLPRIGEIGLDGTVLLFTLGVALLTGFVFGLAPLLHLTRRSVGSAIREGGARNTAGAARLRLRKVLVVSEVALAVVLVVGSGLMIRSFGALQRVDPGFDPENLLTFQIFLPPQGYPQGTDVDGFYSSLQANLTAIPGVEDAAAMNGLPPQRPVNANDTAFENLPAPPVGPPQNTDYWQFTSTNYIETMGIPVLEGRGFLSTDVDPNAPVVLVNQTLANVFYPNESPIGRRLRPPGTNNPWFTIVGVVGDVKQQGVDAEVGTEVYFHHPQAALMGFPTRTMNFAVRTSVPPESVVRSVREAVWALDPTLPLANVRSMEETVSVTIAQPRFLTLLLGIFAAVALSLAAVGTYGVMAYSVAERRQEIGIRMAMGAEASAVQAMVLRQGMLVAGAGLVLGIAAARGLTTFLSSILFEISPSDLRTFLIAPLVLAVVAALASYLPARRATRVDPVQVLNRD